MYFQFKSKVYELIYDSHGRTFLSTLYNALGLMIIAHSRLVSRIEVSYPNYFLLN